MKSWAILPFAVILGTPSIFGQFYPSPPIDPSKCPVGVVVEQNGRLVAYKDAHPGPANVAPQQPSQRFQFKMTNPSPYEIVSVNITAHGFSDKRRLFALSAPAPDLAESVQVAFDVKAHGNASREVLFSRSPIVRTFDVDAVVYADGFTWHAASPGACRVAPNLAMPIHAG